MHRGAARALQYDAGGLGMCGNSHKADAHQKGKWTHEEVFCGFPYSIGKPPGCEQHRELERGRKAGQALRAQACSSFQVEIFARSRLLMTEGDGLRLVHICRAAPM